MLANTMPGAAPVVTINPADEGSADLFNFHLCELLSSGSCDIPPLVALCIGSDRSTGDALGPLVGSLLTAKRPNNLVIYGTLEKPVHALNLAQVYTTIRSRYNQTAILAIDSSLGLKKNVGCLQLGQGNIRPGAGVHKELPAVGDFFITGIVNVGGFMEFMVLQSTRLGLVLPLSRFISEGIARALLHIGSRKPALPTGRPSEPY